MRKLSRRLGALGAFFVVAIALAACGGGVPGDSVADVAGNPITTQAFNHWLLVAAKSQAAQSSGSPVIVPDPPSYNKCVAQVRSDISSLAKTPTKQLKADCKELFGSYASQVMEFLIQGYWYQLEAARDHVTVSNSTVQKDFESQKKAQFPTQAQFQSFLNETGQTEQDIMFRFKINALAAKLLAKHTQKVTPSTIAAYYNAHKSEFGTPEKRNIRLVLTKTAAEADAAKHALASGESWNKVALKYSTDPTTRKTGGLVEGSTKGQLDPAIDDPAFAAPLNKLLGPVKGQFGYYVYEVTGITQATQQTLAQATSEIRQTLSGESSTNAQNALTKLLRSHWLSQTSCQPLYNTTSYCQGYKAPKTSTTAASGG